MSVELPQLSLENLQKRRARLLHVIGERNNFTEERIGTATGTYRVNGHKVAETLESPIEDHIAIGEKRARIVDTVKSHTTQVLQPALDTVETHLAPLLAEQHLVEVSKFETALGRLRELAAQHLVKPHIVAAQETIYQELVNRPTKDTLLQRGLNQRAQQEKTPREDDQTVVPPKGPDIQAAVIEMEPELPTLLIDRNLATITIGETTVKFQQNAAIWNILLHFAFQPQNTLSSLEIKRLLEGTPSYRTDTLITYLRKKLPGIAIDKVVADEGSAEAAYKVQAQVSFVETQITEATQDPKKPDNQNVMPTGLSPREKVPGEPQGDPGKQLLTEKYEGDQFPTSGDVFPEPGLPAGETKLHISEKLANSSTPNLAQYDLGIFLDYLQNTHRIKLDNATKNLVSTERPDGDTREPDAIVAAMTNTLVALFTRVSAGEEHLLTNPVLESLYMHHETAINALANPPAEQTPTPQVKHSRAAESNQIRAIRAIPQQRPTIRGTKDVLAAIEQTNNPLAGRDQRAGWRIKNWLVSTKGLFTGRMQIGTTELTKAVAGLDTTFIFNIVKKGVLQPEGSRDELQYPDGFTQEQATIILYCYALQKEGKLTQPLTNQEITAIQQLVNKVIATKQQGQDEKGKDIQSQRTGNGSMLGLPMRPRPAALITPQPEKELSKNAKKKLQKQEKRRR